MSWIALCDFASRTVDEDLLTSDVKRLQKELADEYKKEPVDQAKISELSASVGVRNEELTRLKFENDGWVQMGGGRYGSNNGFDHVFVKVDENGQKMVLIVDSKQISDGSYSLSNTNYGPQLSKGWVDNTLVKLPPGDPAGRAVYDAINYGDGVLLKAVAGVDRVTGEFKVSNLSDFGSE